MILREFKAQRIEGFQRMKVHIHGLQMMKVQILPPPKPSLLTKVRPLQKRKDGDAANHRSVMVDVKEL